MSQAPSTTQSTTNESRRCEIDPFTLVALESGALKIIKESCEMYKEGRSLVKEVVSEVEGVVKDAKEVQKEVRGIFGFFAKLFGGEKPEPVAQPKPVAKKKKQKEPEFDETAIYSQVGESLMQFFKARNALGMYIKEEEEKTKHVIENLDETNDIAIKLTLANLQMEQMNVDLREYMIYHVPPEMKNLYTRVNEMIGEISNQQAIARQEELVRKRTEAWRREQMRNRIQDQSLTILVTLVMIAWMWGMIIALTHSPQF